MATPLRDRLRPRLVTDEHRVTNFELFFDLVFVFAFTQLTAYMQHQHDGAGIVQAVVLLALIWWSWVAYTWLCNQAHADSGLMRGGMTVAMAAVFVVALATPEAWHDRPGGLDGPIVIATAYIVVRAVHFFLYVSAAGGDVGLQRQLVLTIAPWTTGVALIIVGAVVGGRAQTLLWVAALATDWAGTFVTARRGGGWRLNSLAHWVERHGLVVILALGESIVAVGAGASDRPVAWRLIGAAIVGVLVATSLWWLYFDVSAGAAEESLSRYEGAERVRRATAAYTYAHFLVILGIVLTAFGIEDTLKRVDSGRALGGFAAGALCLGPAIYVLGLAAVWVALDNRLKRPRVIAGAALVIAWPIASTLTPLGAIVLVLAVLAALVAYETRRYWERRAELAAHRT